MIRHIRERFRRLPNMQKIDRMPVIHSFRKVWNHIISVFVEPDRDWLKEV